MYIEFDMDYRFKENVNVRISFFGIFGNVIVRVICNWIICVIIGFKE